MNPTEAKKRIAVLRAQVSQHDELYYRNAKPEISDFDYDALKRELADLEKQFPQFATTESPTTKVGDDRLEGFVQYRHRQRMQSLDNTYSEEELREFHQRLVKLFNRDELAYVIEPKVDGLAVSVTYEQGKLVRAVTRGNGEEGDDITANAKTIHSLPRELKPIEGHPIPDVIEIRGEIYLTTGEFQRINKEREEAGEELYANPRNLAAGTIKQLDTKEVAKRKIEIVLYGVGFCEPAVTDKQSGYHELVKAWGLPTVEKYWKATGIDAVWAAVSELDQLRHSFAYATDGAVVKLDDFRLQREAGSTSKAPRWAIAYKFAAERAETRINNITVQVGRTGVLTPVAELEPVQLAGTTVARATLHNKDEIARKDIRIGDYVLVEKAGEIIPAVIEVNLKRRAPTCEPYEFPKQCPVCGTAVVQLAEEVATRCPNLSCPAQVRRRFGHFVSKGALDIDGLGIAMIDELVEKGWLKELPDLYRLESRREDLLTLGKKVEKSTDNLLKAIEATKTRELWRVIHGLGIPHVGVAASKDLAAHFRDLEKLADANMDDFIANKETVISGIGATMAAAITEFFAESRNRAVVSELLAVGLKPVSDSVSRVDNQVLQKLFDSYLGSESAQASRHLPSRPMLAGMTFVPTGTLPILTRDQMTGIIEQLGGKISGSVSKKTSFVLAGTEAGSKLEKAKTLGVSVIDEAQFTKMITGSAFL